MLKLFQGERYDNLKLPEHLLQKLTGGEKKLLAVGYYYSDSLGFVLMLPNAFKNSGTSLGNDWELLTSLHFMLERYVNDSSGKRSEIEHKFKMPESGKNRKESFLDVLIRIRKFYMQNSGFFFTHIVRSFQPQGAIDWNATLSKTSEIIVNNGKSVIYPTPIHARHDIDIDHQLFILFLSIVRYIKRYGCTISIDIDLDLLSSKEIEGLSTSKRGCTFLKSIRDLYFSDIAVEMWQLCYDFFDHCVDIHNAEYEEYFYTKSFNLVFEKMIDTIIADPLSSKKYSSSWARIDHVFGGPDPVIPGETTIYVLDSKCYEETVASDTSTIKSNLRKDSDSAHKQKAYIDKIYGDAAENGGKTESGVTLLDYVNESYRFIPNCFIVPAGDEITSNLQETQVSDSQSQTTDKPFDYYHWKHKPLFAITTKYLFIFHIDLRRLMTVYSTKDSRVSELFRSEYRKKLHDKIKDYLYSKYDFNVTNPKSGEKFRKVTARLKP